MSLSFGFWTIPTLNLSLCAIPKGGSTMNRAVVARSVGMLDGKCELDWDAATNDMLATHGVTTEYSPSTTNILIARDPWTRAVSSYADQLRRNNIPRNTTFSVYLDKFADVQNTHHTGRAVHKCPGHPGARFDHIVDLERISSFARVARSVPAYGSLLETGWERCTGGDPRLYMPGTVSSHANPDTDMARRLCTTRHISKVCDVYRLDYDLFRRLGHEYPCECSHVVRAAPRWKSPQTEETS